MVPVRDQDAAIAFYVESLDFEVIADVPFGDGEMGGDGTVPKLFFFRDHDANTLMVVERP